MSRSNRIGAILLGLFIGGTILGALVGAFLRSPKAELVVVVGLVWLLVAIFLLIKED